MSVELLRKYLRLLRNERSASQKDLADAMGLSLRALVDWESGKTDDVKSIPLSRALTFLKGSFEDVDELLSFSGEDEDYVLELVKDRVNGRRRMHPRQRNELIGLPLFDRYLTATASALSSVPINMPTSRPGRRVYEGSQLGQVVAKITVDVNGESFAKIFFEEFNETLGTLTWGYPGAGPSRLARALLRYEFDEDTSNIWAWRFVDDVVSVLPRNTQEISWVIESEQIALWLKLVMLIEQQQTKFSSPLIQNQPNNAH